jgi:hypothetical protein
MSLPIIIFGNTFLVAFQLRLYSTKSLHLNGIMNPSVMMVVVNLHLYHKKGPSTLRMCRCPLIYGFVKDQCVDDLNACVQKMLIIKYI